MAIDILISSAVVTAIRAQAAASPNREICGLLLGQAGRIDAMKPAANVAADPARFFEIDPQALFDAIRDQRAGGPMLIGCYHSHPGGTAIPSARDAADAAPDGWLWMIVADDGFTLWRAVPAGALYGRFDPTTFRMI